MASRISLNAALNQNRITVTYMRISKKLVIFVVGFCLPAIMVISSSLSVWFDNRVDELRHAFVDSELKSIQGMVSNDLRQLELFNKIYAIPMMSLEGDNYDAFEEAWLESGIAEYFHLLYIQDLSLIHI